jgi:hypothetical protein
MRSIGLRCCFGTCHQTGSCQVRERIGPPAPPFSDGSGKRADKDTD